MRLAWQVSVGMLSLLGILIGLDSRTFAGMPAEGQDIVHQVQRGDDLRLIAGYYYGDTRQWERIWRTNRSQVRNPNRILPGALLRIPDATAPPEPYADFLARVRRSAVIPEPPELVAPGPPGGTGVPSPPAAVPRP